MEKVEQRVNEAKSKLKKICCCGTGFILGGILALILAIVFLAQFSKYWDKDEHWERGLAYFGLALLLAALACIGVGIGICVLLVVIYRRLERGDFAKVQYKPPVQMHGTAKYPQQPAISPVYQQFASQGSSGQPQGGAAAPAQPSAPPPEKMPMPANPDAVELEEHYKY